jgi:hypothetical protein
VKDTEDDWRLQGQQRYLSGVTLVFKAWRQTRTGWDHDHCEFCGAKFSGRGGVDTLSHGYATEDEYRWICPQCFNDFRGRFRWRTEEGR